MSTIPEFGQSLSPRESEVLSAFCDDCHTAKEIGRKLGISHRTVEIHVANAIVKLGARSQQHAVLMWDRMAHREALRQIADMDPKGLRADDLGRAANLARSALSLATGGTNEA